MLLSRFAVWLSILATTILGADIVSAQNYPTKPIRILCQPAGGGSDFIVRLIATELTAAFGQQVIIDNRPSVLAIDTVAKAPPDGYTLLVHGAAVWLTPFLQDNVSFDARDFAPISLVGRAVNVLVVHPSLPVKSVKELIALAKARPGELNYASGPAGSPNHLGMELLKSIAGLNIVGVRYRGTAEALTALMGGEVQMMNVTTAAFAPLAKSGKLRALAVTSAEPSVLTPGLPTVAAAGVPGYESISIYGIFAPAKAPAAVIGVLNRNIVQALGRADVKEKFLTSGVEPIGSSPEEFAAAIKADMSRWGKVIKDAGIRGE